MARKVEKIIPVRKTLYIDNSLYQQLLTANLSSDYPLECMKDKLIYCVNEFIRHEKQNSAYTLYRKSFVNDLVKELKPMFEDELKRTREIEAFNVILKGIFEYVVKAQG